MANKKSSKKSNFERKVESTVKKNVKKAVKKAPAWAVILSVILVVAILVGAYFVYTKYLKKEDDYATDYIELNDYVDGELSFHFLELGSYNTGDCTLVKVGNTEVLIDAGSKTGSIETVDNYIKKFCTDGKLEYVIVTHAHEDHYACFTTQNSLFNRYDIGTIIDFAQTNQTLKTKSGNDTMYAEYLRELKEAEVGGAVHYTAKECREGNNYEFSLSANVKMTILDSYYYYNKASDGENNHSVCTLFTHGERNFLFTGDLEESGESKLVDMNDLPKVILYKAGHHGSKTSSHNKMLKKIQPQIVCVCCCAGSSEYTKENSNQFPTQEFIDRIAPCTKRIYITTMVEDDAKKTFKSMNGNIIISSKENRINIACSNNTTPLIDTEWFKNNRETPSAWAS